jgi:hypothetical protein
MLISQVCVVGPVIYSLSIFIKQDMHVQNLLAVWCIIHLN